MLCLDRTSNTAWLYNRGDYSVFVLSPTTRAVIKLLPAQSACVYRWPPPRPTEDEDRKTPDVMERPSSDCMLVSFVKGWSGHYNRRSILSCPCWLQVVLAQTADGSWDDSDTEHS